MQQCYITIVSALFLFIKIVQAADSFSVDHFDPHELIKEASENRELFPAASKYNMAVAHDALGNVSQALDWYHQAYYDSHATGSIKGAVLNNMAVILQENGHFDKALPLFAKGIKYGASHIFYNFGLICWDAANMFKAADFFEQAQGCMSDPRSLVNRGVCLYKIGRHDQAIGCWYSAWEKYKDPFAAYNMGLAAADRGDIIRANGWMKKAAKRDCSQAQEIIVPRCSSRPR